MPRLAAFLALLVLAACGGWFDAPAETTEPADLDAMPPFDTARIALVDPDGQRHGMPVYVADDPDTRRQGLMGVTDLPREAGMVFVFSEDRQGGFWMKDTLLPLSIAFFAADGAILAILDMEPCEADPCPSYNPGLAYRGALEVNQGRFDELGLDETWTVELPDELRG